MIHIIIPGLWCCLWGGGTSTWAQKRLWIQSLLHSLHLWNERLRKEKEKRSVCAEPSQLVGEASELAEEQLLSPTPFIHCQSDKDGTADCLEPSHPVVVQCPAAQMEQSNILWRTAVTAKQVKIKLTLFFLKITYNGYIMGSVILGL